MFVLSIFAHPHDIQLVVRYRGLVVDAGLLLYVQRLTVLAGAADRPLATVAAAFAEFVAAAVATGTGQALSKWTLACI